MAGSRCYYPNGTQGASWVHACDPDASASPCCANGATCLSNRLCVETFSDYKTYRGLCTDPTWQSPECGLICAEKPNAGAWVESCEYLTTRADDYCCSLGTEKSCCEDSTRRFKIQPPDLQNWAEWDEDENKYVVVGSVVELSDPATSTLLSTTLEETTTSSEEKSTVAAGQPETTDASTDTSSAGVGQLSTGAKAGVGIGAGIGTILFFVLIWVLIKRYKHHTISEEGQQQGPMPGRNVQGAELPVEFHGPQQQPFPHHIDPSKYQQVQMQGTPREFDHHRRSELSA